MSYLSFRITTHRNEGHTKLATGTICGRCKEPITEGQRYTVHVVRTATMPASGFYYYHWDHAPKQGSGWADFRAGEQINDLSMLTEGDLLLEHSIQFDAFNVIRVMGSPVGDEPKHRDGQNFYGMFVDPADTRESRFYSNGRFCVWDHEIGHTRILYRPISP